MDKIDLEALLFVAKEPLALDQIVKCLKDEEEKMSNDEIEKVALRWLFELKNEYENKGIRIRQVAGGFEMASAPECHAIVEKIVPKEYESLSKAQNETLSIIAYNQNITRATIAKIRGVKNPDEALQRLIDKNLIIQTEEGYITTELFLKFFGINDLKELPPLSSTQTEQQEENLETDENEEIIDENEEKE